MSMIIDGTNGLTFNNATTQASAGQVLQVVSAVQTYVATTSTSLIDTGLTATITPKFTTSKVLVLINLPNIAGPLATWSFVLTDGSNNVIQNLVNYNTTISLLGASYSLLLSPATISAITYKVRYSTSSGTLRLADYAANTHPATITLMEIAG